MVRSDARLLRALTLGVATALVLAACGTGTPSPSTSGAASGGEDLKGGTIYLLTHNELFDQVDPQRAYTGEDLAFFGATIYRSLTAYKYSTDPIEATTLVPDLATDLGTASPDAKDWSFTLRDGATWEDGSDVTCEDVKYGVSRTFATDVINQGPTYQIQYLDIPGPRPEDTKDGFLSRYHGPYDKDDTEGQALYDKAVECDGNKITFHLNGPHADFNYTVTLGFSPVPEAKDTGEKYGDHPVSSGPYKVDTYDPGVGGKMVLVRNDAWDPASDPYRLAYPDVWEVDFGLDEKVIDQRLIESSGPDTTALEREGVQPENLAKVFIDPATPQPQFEGRAWSGQDPYALYVWINVEKVPNQKIRQAMAVALDREALRKNAGGTFTGDLADGVIKPNIGQDYAESGMWTDMFGQAVPDTGDPDLAKQLIADSGEAAPHLTYDYAQSPTADKSAAIIKESLEKAGFTVTANPIEAGAYYSIVFDPKKKHEFGAGGWGADWPNASTVIPPLFSHAGGWDLSEVEDKDFNAKIAEAFAELDRAKQAKLWQDLNEFAMEQAWVIPTRFELTQRLAGTNVQPVYSWEAYGSWPYGIMYTTE
jgi:peptide/nickel transport system substrate-binding protein